MLNKVDSSDDSAFVNPNSGYNDVENEDGLWPPESELASHEDMAMAYARLGLKFVPLHPMDDSDRCVCDDPNCDEAGLHPLMDEMWGIFATSDLDEIRSMFGATPSPGIAFATGEASGGVVGVRIAGSSDEAQHLGDMLGEHHPTPTLRRADGSLLYLYRADGPMESTYGLLGDDLDIFAEDEFVVLPPTKPPGGSEVEWHVSPCQAEIAELPRYVLDYLDQAVPLGDDEVDLVFGQGQCAPAEGETVDDLAACEKDVARADELHDKELATTDGPRASSVAAQRANHSNRGRSAEPGALLTRRGRGGRIAVGLNTPRNQRGSRLSDFQRDDVRQATSVTDAPVDAEAVTDCTDQTQEVYRVNEDEADTGDETGDGVTDVLDGLGPEYVTANDYAASLTTSRSYQYEPLLEAGAMVILCGKPSSGKSMVALAMAVDVAVTQPVIYVLGEGHLRFSDRLEAQRKLCGVATLGKLVVRKKLPRVRVTNERDAFLEDAEKVRPALVVFDTLSAAIPGQDENSAR